MQNTASAFNLIATLVALATSGGLCGIGLLIAAYGFFEVTIAQLNLNPPLPIYQTFIDVGVKMMIAGVALAAVVALWLVAIKFMSWIRSRSAR